MVRSPEDNKLQGSTATIVKGTPISDIAIKAYGTDQELAIKFFNGESGENFAYEVYLMSLFCDSACPFLIKLLAFSQPEKAIVMKCYPSNLGEFSRKSRFRLSPSKIMKIARDLAEGMRVLHDEARILHLDLKPGNVLINDQYGIECVITDFGYASIIGDNVPVARGMTMPINWGLTIPYAAPEVLVNMSNKTTRFQDQKDKPIDVYAFAMTLYEVIMQQIPWANIDPNQVYKRVLEGDRPQIIEEKLQDIPKIVNLVRQCWAQDPASRPTFKQIVEFLS